jgi:peroxidase
MKINYLFFGFLKAATDRAEDHAHATLNAPDVAAIQLAQIFDFASNGPQLKSAEKSKKEIPIAFHNKIKDTVCKDSAIDQPEFCPNVATQRYPTYDGSCNNRIDINRGKAFRPLKRLLPANYGDGFETVRTSVIEENELPSARFIANYIESDIESNKNKLSYVNHMFTQWGQYIVHDIAHTPVVQAPGGEDLDCNCDNPHPQCINIEIGMDDIQYRAENKTCFALPRSSPSPDKDCNFKVREQVNQISATLDANTVYGVHLDLLADLRDPNSDSGELLVSQFGGNAHGDMLPQSKNMRNFNKKPFECPVKLNTMGTNCFFAGDKRINENAGLASMHTIFMREHNRVARMLKKVNPHWTSDEIFDETRLIIIAMHQAITYKEYLPLLLGPKYMDRYDLNLVPAGYFYGYDASIDSSVSNEFTTAAFRFGHSMINNMLSRPNSDWIEDMPPIMMKSAQFNPEAYINNTDSSVNPITRGLMKDMSNEANVNFPSSMKDFLFAETGKFGKDLFAINIQRGRDHGLRSYNDYRKFFGMARASTFAELKDIPADLREKLSTVYAHVDDIDVYVGGLAEDHVDGGLVGPLFAHMMAAQFRDIKRGDRFYFENGACETIFTPAQLDELKKITLSSLLCTCTDTTTVQRKPFHPPGNTNQHCLFSYYDI